MISCSFESLSFCHFSLISHLDQHNCFEQSPMPGWERWHWRLKNPEITVATHKDLTFRSQTWRNAPAWRSCFPLNAGNVWGVQHRAPWNDSDSMADLGPTKTPTVQWDVFGNQFQCDENFRRKAETNLKPTKPTSQPAFHPRRQWKLQLPSATGLPPFASAWHPAPGSLPWTKWYKMIQTDGLMTQCKRKSFTCRSTKTNSKFWGLGVASARTPR